MWATLKTYLKVSRLSPNGSNCLYNIWSCLYGHEFITSWRRIKPEAKQKSTYNLPLYLLYILLISFTLYPAHSMEGRWNLLLSHCISFFNEFCKQCVLSGVAQCRPLPRQQSEVRASCVFSHTLLTLRLRHDWPQHIMI